MSTDPKLRDTGCPVSFALDLFGDRWSLLVIRDMLIGGRSRYREFLEAGEGISTNILADRLRSLEAAGLILRRRDPENGRSVIYELTDQGRDLAPVLIEIVRWSGRHDRRPVARKDVLARIEADREGFEAALRAGKGGR